LNLPSTVIPAKAGIHLVPFCFGEQKRRLPAFAGMTGKGMGMTVRAKAE